MAATRDTASLPALKGGRLVTTCACSACLSGDNPKSCTRMTLGSPRILVSMLLISWRSEAVSTPSLRAAMSVATPCLESWKGCARLSAWTDGELAGRKLL